MEQQEKADKEEFNTDDPFVRALLEAVEGIARSDAKTRERVQQKEMEFFN